MSQSKSTVFNFDKIIFSRIASLIILFYNVQNARAACPVGATQIIKNVSYVCDSTGTNWVPVVIYKLTSGSLGNVGVGTTNPTAQLSLAAGTAAANTAPIKLTAGPVMTTPEAGAIEFDGTSMFLTNAAGTRQALGSGGGGIAISGSGGTTGLTLTGGPISSAGTLTIGGTLAVANGGTGTTTGSITGTGALDFTAGGTNQNVTITPSGTGYTVLKGNVGIGTVSPVVTLDVGGGIRAGSNASVTTCGLGAANGEGTQRYNYTTHRMEYCNGTAWSSPGSPSPTMQVFTSSGTWTKPSGAVKVKITAVGGGGGGKGIAAASYSVGGGGGGGACIKYLDVSAISSATITVGAGGAAGTSGGGNGGNGGASSFGTDCVAGGGTGASSTYGASGGTGTAGDILVSGSGGVGTGGGASLMGGGAYTQGVNVAGANGGNYGGGGAGASGNSINNLAAAGGAGAPGIVIVEEYY